MLQQTQVSRVIDRWHEFLDRFPTATACADGTAADVIGLWAGLGYNRRAVNLWRAAVEVRDRFDGELPDDVDQLQSLPGIGPYTARAVAAFAFEMRVGVVDTNVGRLLARWTNDRLTPRQAQQLADALVPAHDPWSWNQALFDFANATCTKRDPRCETCPLVETCAWRGKGDDPAIGSAGVSTGQSKFEGSKRQVRGRILDRLRQGPADRVELNSLGRAADDQASLDAIVAGLVADGLVEVDGSQCRLPA